MILITKGKAPRKLTVDGAARAQLHCDAYDADPAGYKAGTSKFTIAEGIFSHSTVKNALEKAQYGKCCYCEAALEKPYAHFHVEHWRPKAYSKQTSDGEKVCPGYYWLAYDWENLFLACYFCNSSNKGNIFPLFDPAARARSHHQNVSHERPKLLKPDGPADPRNHIVFHEEVPIGKTPEGRETVMVLGLDRTEHTSRLTLLNRLKYLRGLIERYRNDPSEAAKYFVAEARSLIAQAVLPDAPFSAMATAFVLQNPTPP